MSGHNCPAADCTVIVPFGRFACPRHWLSLPPEVRARISQSWRAQDLLEWLAACEEAFAIFGAVASEAEPAAAR